MTSNRVYIVNNTIADNYCFNGLITLKGMEKESWIFSNNIQRNDGVFMVNVDMDSHSEILGFIEAYLTQNVIQVLSLTSLTKFYMVASITIEGVLQRARHSWVMAPSAA